MDLLSSVHVWSRFDDKQRLLPLQLLSLLQLQLRVLLDFIVLLFEEEAAMVLHLVIDLLGELACVEACIATWIRQIQFQIVIVRIIIVDVHCNLQRVVDVLWIVVRSVLGHSCTSQVAFAHYELSVLLVVCVDGHRLWLL